MAILILLFGFGLSQISPSISFCDSQGGLTAITISLSPDLPFIGLQSVFINTMVTEPNIYPKYWLLGAWKDSILNPNNAVGQFNIIRFNNYLFGNHFDPSPGIYPVVGKMYDIDYNVLLCFTFNVTVPKTQLNYGSLCNAEFQGYFYVYNVTFGPVLFYQNYVSIYGVSYKNYFYVDRATITIQSKDEQYKKYLTYSINTTSNPPGSLNNYTFTLPIIHTNVVGKGDFETIQLWDSWTC